jgi:dinuclear metal center YbgI/SA1388 family protein
MTTGDICKYLDHQIPPALQESYDNSGLQAGSYSTEISSALLTIDVNEDVVNEAENAGSGLIISHHPLIFSPLKRVTDNDSVQRTVMNAIRNGISIYSAHTNLDSVHGGVSFKMAEKLKLLNPEVLAPVAGKLIKLVTFVPLSHLEEVRQAIFDAGAGQIGNYDSCAYQSEGVGTFRGNDQSNPFAGTRGELHREPETRLETILPSYLSDRVIKALTAAHPYEEPAYDLFPLLNEWNRAGLGCTGTLENETSVEEFLKTVKETFSSGCLRYAGKKKGTVRKVALCGGAGVSLLKEAIAARADIFITGDIRYHQFTEAENEIVLVDAGHFETEKFSMEIISDLIIKKFPNFALRFSETITNPINYY